FSAFALEYVSREMANAALTMAGCYRDSALAGSVILHRELVGGAQLRSPFFYGPYADLRPVPDSVFRELGSTGEPAESRIGRPGDGQRRDSFARRMVGIGVSLER